MCRMGRCWLGKRHHVIGVEDLGLDHSGKFGEEVFSCVMGRRLTKTREQIVASRLVLFDQQQPSLGKRCHHRSIDAIAPVHAIATPPLQSLSHHTLPTYRNRFS